MEERITEILLNWVNIKEEVPKHNFPPHDRRYREKITSLIEGDETLGSIPYDEWSKKMDCLYATEFKKWPVNDYYEFDGLTEIISKLIFQVLMEKAPKDRLGNNAGAHLYAIAWKLLEKLIDILCEFPSKYILLSIKDEKRYLYGKGDDLNQDEDREFSEMYSEDSYLEILSAVQSIKQYAKAVSAAHEDDFEPLRTLCDLVIDSLKWYRVFAVEESIRINKGSQQRNAAKIKNTPNRKTKKYAISLYEKKQWKSVRQASFQLLPNVCDYGKTEGFPMQETYQAQALLYKWLLAHKKDFNKT